MTPRMQPIEKDGVLRPDLDFRDVPAGVMALYLGIERSTLYRRTLRGFYRRGVRRAGAAHLYQPRIVCAEVVSP